MSSRLNFLLCLKKSIFVIHHQDIITTKTLQAKQNIQNIIFFMSTCNLIVEK